MAYNPYQVAQSQTGLMEALYGGEQQQKAMESAATGHKGKMTREFNEKLRAAEEKARQELSRKKKGSKFGKIASFLSSFAGPIAGPILSGLISGIEMKGQSDFATKQAKRAKAAALGIDMGKYGGTFLGDKIKDYKSKQESSYDQMIKEADVGFGDLFKTALGSGLTSMAMGKATKGIKGKIGDVKAAKGIEKAVGGEEGLKKLANLSESGKLSLDKFGVKVKGGTLGEQIMKKSPLSPGAIAPGIEKFDPAKELFGDIFAGDIASKGTVGIQQTPSNLIGADKVTASKLAELGITKEQLAQFQGLQGKGYDFDKGIFGQLLGKGSPMQQEGQFGLETEQGSLMANLLPFLSQLGLE